MRKFTKGILTGLCAVVGFTAGVAAYEQVATVDNVTTAQANATYATKDIAMMGRVAGWYGNGNFEIRLTLGEADWSGDSAQKDYAGEGELAEALTKLDFFNKIKLGEKTLAQWGCTACYDNWYKVNSGEPDYTLMIPLKMSSENMAAASEAGIGADTPFTILEGALIPSDAYLQGNASAMVFRAGCTYETVNSGVAYGIMGVGKTEVESVQYVTGWDSTHNNAYFGVSLKGDDYAGNGLQTEVNQENYQSSEFTTNRFTNKIMVDGEAGKAENYGLYNLGEKGKGYYSFVFRAQEETTSEITIPAGTLFPSYAMTNLYPVNSNPVYIMYQTQTDVTFYKQSDGSWSTTKEQPTVEKETEIVSAFVDGTADCFAVLKLGTHDYPTELDNWDKGSIKIKDFFANGNFYTHVLIDGVALGSTGEAYLNVWGNKGAICFRGVNANTQKITVLEGCQIPTYNALMNGAKEMYVVKETVTFVKNANGEFELEIIVPEEVLTAREKAVAELESYKANEVYFEEQVAARKSEIEKAKTVIGKAVTVEEVENTLKAAMTAIDGIQTKAQVVASAISELEGYKAEDGYFKEKEAQERANIVAEAKTAIESAATQTAVNSAVKNAKAAIDLLLTASEAYETTDVAMIGRIGGWYGSGNFTLGITLGQADWTNADNGGKMYEGDLANLLKKLGFFDHIVVFGKTLAEWGCNACHIDNGTNYDLNTGEPDNKILFRLAMSGEDAEKATAAGFAGSVPVTILEGALIPSYGYLTKTSNVVYRAGADYVTTTSTKAYGIEAVAKTTVESVKYVQGHDGAYGYFGVSFVGDDYLGDGSQLDVNQNYYYDNRFDDMILVNGEEGHVKYYGLFNLGEAGLGYYSFQIDLAADDIVSITIPAGTRFPTRAMTELFTVNSNPVYIMYEVETEVTLYKTADGYGTYAEYVIPELEGYKTGLFREAEEAQRATIIANAKTEIATLTDKEAIDTVVATAKTAIDQLKTAAQYADEELAGDKATAVATVEGYKADVAYLDEQAQTKANIINEAKAAIAAAASVDEINTAVAAATAAIDEIVVKATIVEAAIAEVEGYKTDVVYLEAQATQKAAIVEEALTAIETATSQAAIEEIVSGAKTAIDALKSKAEVEEEALNAAKQAANTAVDEMKRAIDYDLYEDSAIITINGLYAAVKANIAAATTEDAINALVDEFETALANVPTKNVGGDSSNNSGSTGSSDSDSNSSSTSISCGGTVSGFACALALLGTAAVALLKKKEN